MRCLIALMVALAALANGAQEDKLVDKVIAAQRKLETAETKLLEYCKGKDKLPGIKRNAVIGCVGPQPPARPALPAPQPKVVNPSTGPTVVK